MSDVTLPVWALVAIPLFSAVVGAASGPLTEKLRSDTEARNRQADRDATAKAKSAEIQQATIIELQNTMKDLEACANVTLRELAWQEESHVAFDETRNRADALRVRLTDQEARDLVQSAMKAVRAASARSLPGDPRDIGERIRAATGALQAMNERLGVVYRSLTP
jgi:hypothetical protein